MGSRVLVVEDNAFNMRLVEAVLTVRGHTVEGATNVQEGRERLGAARFDLVLMDVQIPGGGGETLLQEIRRDPALEQTPVIAFTALAMSGDRERLLAAGFDAYLSKPIDTRTFGPSIESVIAEGRTSTKT
jgi:CheY-like chemotaxis protein